MTDARTLAIETRGLLPAHNADPALARFAAKRFAALAASGFYDGITATAWSRFRRAS